MIDRFVKNRMKLIIAVVALASAAGAAMFIDRSGGQPVASVNENRKTLSQRLVRPEEYMTPAAPLSRTSATLEIEQIVNLATGIKNILATPAALAAGQECVRIYYDQSSDETYLMGKTYAIFLQNLLGHFPELQQVVSPIELYKRGDIEKCRASIYMGSYYRDENDNGIPPEFVEDFVATKKQVAWLGYNVWKFGPEFEKAFGYKFKELTVLDPEHLDPLGKPTFFRDIYYKGEKFFKYADWKKDPWTGNYLNPRQFLAPFEMLSIQKTREGVSEVLATAKHSYTGQELPYAIRSNNKFYFTDVPFSFMHEADRYFIFADVLFDILKMPARHNGKYSIVRIEDVHALIPIPFMWDVLDVHRAENIPMTVSLIPIFFDPLKHYDRKQEEEYVEMDRSPEFMNFVNEASSTFETVWIQHGVTHQLGKTKNPHDASSGSDFEFWDAINRLPLPNETNSWVVDRFEEGFDVLKRAGIHPKAWLTPHYQASPLDYYIMARIFPWNVGRIIYFNHRVYGIHDFDRDYDTQLNFSSTYNDPNARKRRSEFFKDLTVEYDSMVWNGQMFPYEIHGDLYGQRVIPESLGNSQPYRNEHVHQPRSVQEIVADARRNLVLRDVWGSLFYHPYLLDSKDATGEGRGVYPGDPQELLYIVHEMKQMGYNFINLDKFIDNNKTKIRPEPIYITPSGEKTTGQM